MIQDRPRLEGLDGIRALTTLAVTYSHLWLFDLGWIGLHTFFVLSGFLITRVLLNDREASGSLGEYLKRFYVRRALRVFPIYFAYLLALLIGGWLLLPADAWSALSPHFLPASLYVYNFFHLTVDFQHSFFVTHLWSMSVEEQFYLIWPWVIYLLHPSRHTRVVLIGLVLAGPLLRWTVASLWPAWPAGTVNENVARAVFMMTPCYLDAFAIGALINFLRIRTSGGLLLGMAALMLVLGMVINGPGLTVEATTSTYLSLGWPRTMPDHAQYIWGYSLINLFLFLFISNVVYEDGGLRHFFRKPALEYFGVRSYSTYIVQFPLLGLCLPLVEQLINHFSHRVVALLVFSAGFIPLNVAIAHLTYRFIELPAIRLKKHF